MTNSKQCNRTRQSQPQVAHAYRLPSDQEVLDPIVNVGQSARARVYTTDNDHSTSGKRGNSAAVGRRAGNQCGGVHSGLASAGEHIDERAGATDRQPDRQRRLRGREPCRLAALHLQQLGP